MRSICALACLVSLHAVAARAANEVVGIDALRQRLGLQAHHPASLASVKIAVLDNGFEGYVPGRGLLPDSAELVPAPLNEPAPTAHGLGMAQTVWAIAGKSSSGPKFYLLNTNGWTNFKAAVDFVVQNHVDIVLYSQVWTFGSNFDGTGFINQAVSRATQAGAIWINAAGNFGGEVYNGSVLADLRSSAGASQPAPSGTGMLSPRGREGLRFVNRLDENAVEITLSWTDFQGESYSTPKDLDLLVYDPKGSLVGSSELIQRGQAPTDADPTLSSYAREKVVLPNLDRGTYVIKVRAQSSNFAASDRYRVVIDSEKPGSLDFTDRTTGQEIFAPADSPDALTVGEASPVSSQGPTADGRIKPEVWIRNATVSFSNGMASNGSSNAAALVAGCAAVMKAEKPTLTRDQFMAFARSLGADRAGDLRSFDTRAAPQNVLALVPPGGQIALQANGHYVILSPQDPFTLSWATSAGARKTTPNDVLAVSLADRRWYSVSPQQLGWIKPPLVEFRQLAAGEWRMP